MEASNLGRVKRVGEREWGHSIPVGEIACGAGEASEELLELAESGVAGEVGGWFAPEAAAGELRLVAVEDGALIPPRHGGGGGGLERDAGAWVWTERTARRGGWLGVAGRE